MKKQQQDPTLPITPIVAGAKFELGELYMTTGARDSLQPFEITALLKRHAHCDWGVCGLDDAESNDEALIEGSRVLSVYRSNSGEKVWLITEADRSATTILMPSEY